MKLTAAQQHVLDRLADGWDLFSRDFGRWYLSSPHLDMSGRMPFRQTEPVSAATFGNLVALGKLTADGKRAGLPPAE